MKRTKKKPPTEQRKERYPLPLEIEQGIQSRRITKRSIARYLEKTLLYYTPYLTPIFFREQARNMMRGDNNSLERWARIAGYIKPSDSGTTITMIQGQVAGGGSAEAMSDRKFESFARELIAKKKLEQLESPSAVIDVTPEPSKP